MHIFLSVLSTIFVPLKQWGLTIDVIAQSIMFYCPLSLIRSQSSHPLRILNIYSCCQKTGITHWDKMPPFKPCFGKNHLCLVEFHIESTKICFNICLQSQARGARVFLIEICNFWPFFTNFCPMCQHFWQKKSILI